MHRHFHSSSVAGFTLIEVLVALVVLSVGMLGVSALYVQGMGAGRTAQYRSQAISLAGDIADRIRVNRTAIAAYGLAAANSGCDPVAGVSPGIDCTPAQLAADDLDRWQAQLGQLLPGGNGAVLVNPATTPPTYTIQVNWTEVNQGAVQYQTVIQVPNF